KVTLAALEIDIVSSALKVAHYTSFEVISSGTEVEQTSSGLNIKVAPLSFTCVEFTSLTFTSQYAKITSIYTYQQSEVASHSYTYQFLETISSSNYQYNLQEEDTFDD
ncbi:6439_t:CDS:2, partial [Gigaspora rosea]